MNKELLSISPSTSSLSSSTHLSNTFKSFFCHTGVPLESRGRGKKDRTWVIFLIAKHSVFFSQPRSPLRFRRARSAPLLFNAFFTRIHLPNRFFFFTIPIE
jgi:hypothetical protein